MAHWECKYCDRPAGYMGIPIKVGDEEVCACGAEWADARILVEDEEVEDFDEEDDFMHDEPSNWDQDDESIDDDDFGLLDCGCCPCCGCSCYDLEDDYEEED